MRAPLILLSSLFALLLQACATRAPIPTGEGLFADALFAAPARAIDHAAVFAVSAPMARYVDESIAARLYHRGLDIALVDALYNQQQLKLDYDASHTLNASQAFAARSGNCLSLVLMTAAIAKRLGLPITYQRVYAAESWSRSGGLAFASEHVNLLLEPSLGGITGSRISHSTANALVVDFLPPELTRGQRVRAIPETTVMAMYFNNRAAEQLAAAQLDEAYWWAREAILTAPTHLAGHNTLGVIYLQRQQPARAEKLFSHVLAQEPANTLAMSNLTLALQAQGRHREAAKWQAALAAVEPHPPFHFFDLGMAALKKGEYLAAKKLFEKELRRDAYAHEFHFWLGIAEIGLGDARRAQKHLTSAIDQSTTRGSRELYVAKLDYLRKSLIQ